MKNSRDLQDAYMMIAASYKQKQDNAISDNITSDNLDKINDVFTFVIPVLKTIREKLHSIEYAGGDHTVHSMCNTYQQIDGIIDSLLKVNKKVNKLGDIIDISEYLNQIKDLEKEVI